MQNRWFRKILRLLLASLIMQGCFAEKPGLTQNVQVNTSETLEPVELELAQTNVVPATGTTQANANTFLGLPGPNIDKTGTNPNLFQETYSVVNQFRKLEGRKSYYNATLFRAEFPTSNRRASIRNEIPMIYIDNPQNQVFGLGDVQTRLNYLPILKDLFAMQLRLDLYWPTATHEALGTGKLVAAPQVIVGYTLPGNTIIAPAYQHSFSYAGNPNRPSIHKGDIDLYIVKRSKNTKSWIIVDPDFMIDYQNGTTAATIEIETGRVFWKGVSLYVRPGLGIGDARPYNFQIETGIRHVH